MVSKPAAEDERIVPAGVIDGIREMLRRGMTRREVADRLGPIIDAIAGDLAAARRERRPRIRRRRRK